MTSPAGIFIYTGPVVSLIFATTFSIVWFYQQRRRYILLFAVAFLAFAGASLSQMLHIPDEAGANAMISGTLYTFSILCLSEGVMTRLKVSRGDVLIFGLAGATMVLYFYYFYIDRNVFVRIYVQNFGYGLMFVVAAIQMARTTSLRGIDKLIFWIVLIFGLHFFPRTILTMRASSQIAGFNPKAPDFNQAEAVAIFARSAFWQVLNFSLLVSSFLVALTLLGAVVSDVIEELRQEGSIDPLTGLANRRGFLRQVKAVGGDPTRSSISVIYCDIDHFKSINDTYGHLTGDQVLQAFARLLKGELRPQDVAARFGGEEFVILLMNANLSGASLFAERLRQEVELSRFVGLPQHWSVTASFGVAQWRPGEDIVAAMSRADKLVYEAKRAGRNRIATEPPGPEDTDEDR